MPALSRRRYRRGRNKTLQKHRLRRSRRKSRVRGGNITVGSIWKHKRADSTLRLRYQVLSVNGDMVTIKCVENMGGAIDGKTITKHSSLFGDGADHTYQPAELSSS